MNPFKPTGFDNMIGKGLIIDATTVRLPLASTMIIDGELNATTIQMVADSTASTGLLDKITPSPNPMKTALVVGGKVTCTGELNVSNVTVAGELTADVVICEGMLAVKAGAKITAKEIRYRSITIEDGAVILAQVGHLDYLSCGEQV